MPKSDHAQDLIVTMVEELGYDVQKMKAIDIFASYYFISSSSTMLLFTTIHYACSITVQYSSSIVESSILVL
jgi:hypothetical protein